MMRFLTRLLIFSIPILVYCTAIAVIDPFDYFGLPSVISPGVKAATAKGLNECFWKMNEFNRHPASSILLGDSRMDAMPTEKVSQAAAREYCNLAFGGASLNEIMDAFWFAARRTRLTNVYIGLNLNVYNDYNFTDRTATYESIAGNPALYFVNRTVLHAAALEAYSQFAGKDLKIGVPQMSRDAFWHHELDVVTAGYYTNYIYPVQYRKRLDALAAYCRKNHINLGFIIFPTHVDLQERIRDFHLESTSRKFRSDLAAWGTTYDFDYTNDITLQKDNFSDPYHYRPPIADVMIGEVWQGKIQYAKRPASGASEAP